MASIALTSCGAFRTIPSCPTSVRRCFFARPPPPRPAPSESSDSDPLSLLSACVTSTPENATQSAHASASSNRTAFGPCRTAGSGSDRSSSPPEASGGKLSKPPERLRG
eukprot:1177776-Prorocentrum_minimum.AAC.6